MSDLETLARAATPGPWHSALEFDPDEDGLDVYHGEPYDIDEGSVAYVGRAGTRGGTATEAVANAAYIAAANPTVILALLARQRQLEAIGRRLFDPWGEDHEEADGCLPGECPWVDLRALLPSVPPEWRTPRGETVEEIVTDATGQVIGRYGEALRKLGESVPPEGGVLGTVTG